MSKSQAAARNSVLNVMRGFAGKENFITTPLTFVDFCDGDHIIAMFFSQCLYWVDRTDDPEGWIIKTNEEWYEEMRLSRSQVERCIKALAKIGLKTKKARSRFHSYAPVIHFRFDMEMLNEKAEAFFSDPFAGKSQMRGLRKSNLRLSSKSEMSVSNESEMMDSSKSLYTETIEEILEEKETTTIPAIAVSDDVSSQSSPQWPDDTQVAYYVEGKREKPAPAENRKQGKAKATTPPSPTPSPAPAPVADVQEFAAKLDAAKGKKVNPAVALGEAWGIAPAPGDFGLYGKQAKALIDNGIPVEEFKAFCDWRKKQAGDWASKIVIGALTGKGYISMYLAHRNESAERDRKQKELAERLYAQYPEARPRDPSEPVEYASPEDIRALISAAMKPTLNTREEAS